MSDDKLAAELDAMRPLISGYETILTAVSNPLGACSVRLLDAVDAVLALHQPGPFAILGHLCKRHEMHRYFSITSTEADHVAACPDCTATVRRSCTGCLHTGIDACAVRVAVSRALLEEVGHG